MATEEVFEYAIRYPDQTVFDPSWRCVSDAIASFAEGSYVDDQRRVTGVLMRAPLGTLDWEVVA